MWTEQLTHLGVGGILAFLIVREVLQFLARKRNGNGHAANALLNELKSHGGVKCPVAPEMTPLKDGIDKLLYMHENADNFGFGTGELGEKLDANTRAIKELTHYIQWFIEQETGKKPPPPVGEGS